MTRLTGAAAVAVSVTVIGYVWYVRHRRRNQRPTLLSGDPSVKHLVPLIAKTQISPDTFNFRFALPTADHVLGLPIGQHVVIYADVDGDSVRRKYTPVTSDEDKGHFDMVIKVYKSSVNPRFPAGGKMSQFVDRMAIGDMIPVSGPVGRLTYHGRGKVSMVDKKTKRKRRGTYKYMGMIAGGSGIAPMLQLIEAVLRDPKDKCNLSLLFANQSEKDILMRDRLQELTAVHPDRLKVWYTVDRAEQPDWRYSTGFVTADMIRDHLPPPSVTPLILICGPPAMIKLACNPNLDKLGYQEEHRFKY